MLRKSLVSDSDVIIYDLEDSVPPSKTDKNNARRRLAQFLEVSLEAAPNEHLFTRMHILDYSCGGVTKA